MRWLIFIVLEGVSNSLHIKITANFLLGRWFLKENEMGECTSKWNVSDNKICPIVFWLLFLIGCWTLLFLHTAEVVFRQRSLLKCQRFMLYLSFDHELKSSEKNKIFSHWAAFLGLPKWWQNRRIIWIGNDHQDHDVQPSTLPRSLVVFFISCWYLFL